MQTSLPASELDPHARSIFHARRNVVYDAIKKASYYSHDSQTEFQKRSKTSNLLERKMCQFIASSIKSKDSSRVSETSENFLCSGQFIAKQNHRTQKFPT